MMRRLLLWLVAGALVWIVAAPLPPVLPMPANGPHRAVLSAEPKEA